jgi:crotonobetainyl-CoA:carnitine CoA-transferase CaiB-like acyl-CoA transferase
MSGDGTTPVSTPAALGEGRGGAPGAKGVLAGVRILDFGRYIAGPYCAAILGDFGAEVIRIEKREGGEDRFTWPLAPGCDAGAQWLASNRNKLSMTLDPMTDPGREIVRRLVATADVVIANLPPSTMAAMRLDLESLRQVKPDIILATSSAYGRQGPLADGVGLDSIGQAMSGGVYLSGTPDGPVRLVTPWVDFGTAVHLACGVLLALLSRSRSGKGQEVEASLLGTALLLGNGPLTEQAVIAADRVPSGNRGQGNAPTDVFRTRDGFVVTHVIGPGMFKRWARLMGEEHWLEDPRFRDDAARGDNRDPICDRMARWCAERTNAEALEALAGAKIPAGPVLKPQEVLDHPQVKAMGFLEEVDYPRLPRPAPIARVAVSLSDTPGSIRHRPPTVGEHTDDILASLGYRPEQIAAFRRSGVI